MGETLSAALETRPSSRRHPFLFLVLECARPTARPARWALSDVDRIEIGRGDRRSTKHHAVDGGTVIELAVPDGRVSERHARLVRIGNRFILEDLGSKNGARIGDRPETRAALVDGDLIELGETIWLYREYSELRVDSGDLDLEVEPGGPPELMTIAPTLESDFSDLRTAAGSDLPILLAGESGTGKELAARAVHRLSGRSKRFVAVNCGALSDSLVESELFGCRKGAFTGADEERPGLVRASDGGTLFLDEIGDLPSGSQAHFLRVLQEREVLPVGETEPVPVDLRVVAASHRPLEEMASQGSFRPDLLARLGGFKVTLPALRDRIEDFGLLVATILSSLSDADRPRALSLDAARALIRHTWPRNVRELERRLKTAATIATSAVLDAERLGLDDSRPRSAPAEGQSSGRPLTLREEEQREELVRLIRKHAGNLSAVAREVAKDRKQVQRWVARYGIDVRRYRP